MSECSSWIYTRTFVYFDIFIFLFIHSDGNVIMIVIMITISTSMSKKKNELLHSLTHTHKERILQLFNFLFLISVARNGENLFVKSNQPEIPTGCTL